MMVQLGSPRLTKEAVVATMEGGPTWASDGK